MRYQIDTTYRHPERLQQQARVLRFIADNPGVKPMALGAFLYPDATCAPKMRAIQAATTARKLKKSRMVKIKYRPSICYYLTNFGYEILSMLTGEQKAQETH